MKIYHPIGWWISVFVAHVILKELNYFSKFVDYNGF